MKGRLYTASDIAALAAGGQPCRLVLAAVDRITPLALDRAHELGVEILFGDGGASNLPTWSGAALQDRRRRGASGAPAATSASAPAPAPQPDPAPAPPADDLEARVRKAVLAALGVAASGPAPAASGPAVHHVDGRSLNMPPFPFEINRPGMDVRLQDVITQAQGSPMAAGFMSLRQGAFPWHLDYDEIEFVIEGELHIGTAQGVKVGRPGDVIFVPKGADITFGTPNFARFFYVTYPAQWSG